MLAHAGVQSLAARLQERATGSAATRMQALQDNPALVEHFCQDLLPHLLSVYNGTLSHAASPASCGHLMT